MCLAEFCKCGSLPERPLRERPPRGADARVCGKVATKALAEHGVELPPEIASMLSNGHDPDQSPR